MVKNKFLDSFSVKLFRDVACSWKFITIVHQWSRFLKNCPFDLSVQQNYFFCFFFFGDEQVKIIRVCLEAAGADLYAADSKYHITCYQTLASERNIKAVTRGSATSNTLAWSWVKFGGSSWTYNWTHTWI